MVAGAVQSTSISWRFVGVVDAKLGRKYTGRLGWNHCEVDLLRLHAGWRELALLVSFKWLSWSLARCGECCRERGDAPDTCREDVRRAFHK